jgi:LEA14-like dessication related protein
MSIRPFAAFAATALCWLALGGCASLTKPWSAPEVAFAGLQPKEIGLNRQSFVVSLLVKNPNDRALPIKAMTYRLYLEGTEIVDGASELDRQIAAFSEETVDVEVNTSLLGLAPRLPLLAMTRDSLNWKIDGTVTIAGGLVTLPYRYSGSVEPGALLAALRP